MTKKDFVNAASLLKASMDQGVLNAERGEVIAKFLCVYFAGSNPRFQTDIFLKACGLGAIRK